MNNRTGLFFQAIRGPIVLITIGSLFAVQQSGGVHVGQTWPLVLIVYGLLRLLERVYAPAPAAPPPGSYVPPPPGGFAPPPPGGYQAPPAAGPGAYTPPSGTGYPR